MRKVNVEMESRTDHLFSMVRYANGSVPFYMNLYREYQDMIEEEFLKIGIFLMVNCASVEYLRRKEIITNDKNNIETIDLKGKSIVSENGIKGMSASFKYRLDQTVYKEKSSDIFMGTIMDIDYISYDGIPWSKMTVELNEVYKGKRESTDEVIIYELGGYLDYNDFKKDYWELDVIDPGNTVVKMNYFQPDLHKIGDKSIFCVVDSISEQPFEKGSYELTCSSFSEFRFDKKENKYCEQKDNYEGIHYSSDKKEYQVQFYSNDDIERIFATGD